MVKKSFKILLVLLMILGCKDKTLKIGENKEEATSDVSPTITDFSITKVKNNQKLWEIKAKTAVLKDNMKAIDVEEGKVRLFDKNSFVANVVFKKARFFNETNDIDFFGKTIINTVENEKIITYDIKYIYSQNKIFSDKEIEIYKDGNIVKGIGFETFDGFKTIRIYKNVITTQ